MDEIGRSREVKGGRRGGQKAEEEKAMRKREREGRRMRQSETKGE